MSSKTDQELWRSFTNGDATAFEVLFKRIYPRLFQYGRKFSSDADFVKDAIQELFIELWQRRTRVSQTPAVREYLYKSLRRKMLRLSTRQPGHAPLDDEAERFQAELSPEQIFLGAEGEDEQRRQLTHWFAMLTPRQREALYLRYHHEMEYDEMATVMNIGVTAVRNLVYEALKVLRARLTGVILLLVSLAN